MPQTITASFGLDINPLRAGWNQAASLSAAAAKGIGNRITSLLTSPLAAVTATVSGFLTYETFKNGIAGVIDTGTELERLHKQTGIAVGGLATLRGVFKQADVNADELGTSIGKMQQNLFMATAEGGKASGALGALNVDVGGLLKLKPEEQFLQIGRAISGLPEPMLRTAAATAIFGKTGAELLPVFDELGNVNFASLSQNAAIMERDSEKFHQITINFRKARTQLNGVFLGIADALVPSLLAMSKLLSTKSALGFGMALGQGLKTGTEVLFGAFRDPNALGDLIANGVGLGFAKAGNFLVNNMMRFAVRFTEDMLLGVDVISRGIDAGLAVATDHFKNGMLVVEAGMIRAAGMFASTLLAGVVEAGKFLKQDMSGLEAMINVVSVAADAMAMSVLGGTQKPRTFMEAFQQQPLTGVGKLALKSINSGMTSGNVDFFNQRGFERGMTINFDRLQQSGAAALAPYAAQNAVREPSYQATHFLPMNGGLQTGHLTTGNLRGGAYHSIHSGDAYRAKAERAKAQTGQDPWEGRFKDLMQVLREGLTG